MTARQYSSKGVSCVLFTSDYGLHEIFGKLSIHRNSDPAAELYPTSTVSQAKESPG